MPRKPSPAAQPAPEPPAPAKRRNVQQTDIPSVPLDEALRVPRAFAEYAFRPVSVLDAATAIGMQPGSGPFRTLLSASAAYGLSEGSAWAEKISITPLGRRLIEAPSVEDRRRAVLTPRIPREFLEAHDGNKVPREDIAKKELSGMGVPEAQLDRVLKQILADARSLGLLTSINGIEYVRMEGSVAPVPAPAAGDEDSADADEGAGSNGSAGDATGSTIPPAAAPAAAAVPTESRKMYLSHGSNKSFVELLKQLLKISELEAVVTEQRDTAAVPVPEKVTDDMRACSSAIIHVDAERTVTDAEGKEYVLLNENVLIEIGAAMALYGKRFILLVREGIKLPSNLQGLYEVRYGGDTLDAETALKLLGSIADVKNRPLPVKG